MEPQHAITYNNSNTNKKVIYRTFVTNNYPPVPDLGSFNQLINSGIVHPTGVLIVPFLAPVTRTNGGLGDSQWKSPFDKLKGIIIIMPLHYFPSIINQFTSLCRLSKRLQSTLQYDHEHFLARTS
jgi:hypothetical protein